MNRFNSEVRSQKSGVRSACRGAVALACGLVLVLLAGCEVFGRGKISTGKAIPKETFQQIKPLHLEEAPSQGTDPNARPKPVSPAPESLELTLEQCRVMALQNNLALKATLIDPTLSEERLNQERAKFEASFSANTTLDTRDAPSISTYDAFYGSQRNTLSMGAGIQKPFETGGSISLGASDNRTRTNVDPNYTLINPTYSSGLQFSISQPLLRNRGAKVSTYSIRVAALERQITDARTKLEVIRLIADVDRLYWRLVAARKELDVRRKQLDLARAQLDQARRLVGQGERAPVEIIRAQAGVAQQMEAIITAENNLQDRQRELKRLVNQADLGMQTPTKVVPLTEPTPVLYDLKSDPLISSAVTNRMEMLELELQLAQDSLTIDYQRNQSLPLVTFDYTYSLNGTGASRDDSWGQLSDNLFSDNTLGLRLQIPLGNEAAKSRVRQAVYQKCQRLATREDRRSQIEQEVLNALSKLEANWQRIMANQQNTILQGRLYEAEKRQFEQGLRTSTDVLDAQAKLATAQSTEISALTDYQIALVDLAYATGTLLGASNIEWQPIKPTDKGR